jgi:phosphate transport system substrate-binding protein
MKYEQLRSPIAILAIIQIAITLTISTNSRAEALDSVRISGSKYTYYTALDISKLYLEKNPYSEVKITEADHHEYLQSLQSKVSDVIMTFGRLEEDIKVEATDTGIQLSEQIVGWGGVVLITDPTNQIEELTIDQVRGIFSGQYRNWKELGGPDLVILPMSRDESVSGTERLFRQLVLHDSPFAQHTIRLFDPDICRAVRNRKGSIADARYTEAIRGRIKGLVKVIAIKVDEDSQAICPSVESVQKRLYPLCAPMMVYFNSALLNHNVIKFINFWAGRGLVKQFAERSSDPD